MRSKSLILIFLIICNFAFAEELQVLDKITVRRNRDDFSQKSFFADQINDFSANSAPSDALNNLPSVDLRSRSQFGIQGDLTLRGSTYEQVAVLIDGIKVMDPQTGHYNLDIPLTNFDIERLDLAKTATSALYGAGAMAGSADFVIKKIEKEELKLESSVGDYALRGEAFSYSLPHDVISGRISFDHKKAKAARPNTDFEYKTGTLYLDKRLGSSKLNTLLGWQKKDYGADSFYSNLFPEEEEHTETLFIKTGLDSKLQSATLENNLYLRKHRDKFILRRNNPTSVNYHTTYVYGYNSRLELPVRIGKLLFGLDVAENEINSTNLGKHSRMNEAGLAGFAFDYDKLNSEINFRLDHYQQWPIQKSFNLGLGYKLMEDKLKLKASVSHSFRIPTFTELYYSDAANQGDPNLGIEKSYTFTLGADYRNQPVEMGVEGFLRQGFDLIDWTRVSSNNIWNATNLGRVDFRGVIFTSKINLESGFQGLKLKSLNFSYSYNSADRKQSGFLSKYALDILMHQFIFGIKGRILGVDLDWGLSYNKRYYAEDYLVGNIYLSKKLNLRGFTLEPFVKIDNFTNTKYSEVSGVLEPGRWVQGGLKFAW